MRLERSKLLHLSTSVALAFCLLISQAVEARPAPPEGRRVFVDKDLLVELELDTPLDSGTAKPGEQVSFHLARPLIAGGTTVLPTGLIVEGRVSNARPAGNNCNYGAVDWRFADVAAADGTRIELRTATAFRMKDGTLVETNRPLTGEQKAQRALVYVVFSPLIAVGLALVGPWLLLDKISDGRCNGIGREMRIKAGSKHFAAVRKGVTVSIPGQPAEAPVAPSGANAAP